MPLLIQVCNGAIETFSSTKIARGCLIQKWQWQIQKIRMCKPWLYTPCYFLKLFLQEPKTNWQNRIKLKLGEVGLQHLPTFWKILYFCRIQSRLPLFKVMYLTLITNQKFLLALRSWQDYVFQKSSRTRFKMLFVWIDSAKYIFKSPGENEKITWTSLVTFHLLLAIHEFLSTNFLIVLSNVRP